MALQAGLLERLLRQDCTPVELLGHNQAFSRCRFLERVPGVRTVLRTALFSVRFCRQARRADVVHILSASGLNFFLVVCSAIVLGRLMGKRMILNYRAGNADSFFRYWGWLAGLFIRMAHVTTAPSGFLAEVIQRRIGVPVTIVANILNFSIFRYRERPSFGPRMIVTRHLEKLYDVELVVRAFREVQRNYPAASLRIAGTGSQERRLRELVAEWNLTDVRFLGYVDHKTLPAIYDDCDILLNASRVDNFPGSLMEASAAGLVVVSTNAGGIPYLYQDGKNALLVEVGDWEGLARGVERVLQDQELSRKLAFGGVELCRQCEWETVRRALYRVYGFNLSATRTDAEPGRTEFVSTAGS
jgi:glycosyltransferase involved in cell wall biosynthesis